MTHPTKTFVLPRLYAILDPSQLKDTSASEAARQLVEAGVKLIQYRNKNASSRELYEGAMRLTQAASRSLSKVSVIINDRADIALLTGAAGVHVGQDDLPVESARAVAGEDAVVGFSTHTLEQVAEADRGSADYIAYGPVFATETKENPGPVVGLEGLREARKVTRKPLVAIGGITLERAPETFAVGADSVAVVRDLIGREKIGERACRYLEVLGSVGSD